MASQLQTDTTPPAADLPAYLPPILTPFSPNAYTPLARVQTLNIHTWALGPSFSPPTAEAGGSRVKGQLQLW